MQLIQIQAENQNQACLGPKPPVSQDSVSPSVVGAERDVLPASRHCVRSRCLVGLSVFVCKSEGHRVCSAPRSMG